MACSAAASIDVPTPNFPGPSRLDAGTIDASNRKRDNGPAHEHPRLPFRILRTGSPATLAPADDQPGVCTSSCRDRQAPAGRTHRRGGRVALGALLVAIDAPNWTRLLIAIPAVMAASGYIQARLKFRAGFGSRGVFNFGEVGPMERVAGEADRAPIARGAPDRRGKHRIGLAAGVIAAVRPI